MVSPGFGVFTPACMQASRNAFNWIPQPLTQSERRPSSSSTLGSRSWVWMMTWICSFGRPSFQNAGCLAWKSLTCVVSIFSMTPVTVSPGWLFAPK